MTKWEMVKLSDCIKLSSGKFLPMKSRIEGKYNVYGGNGITGNHNEYFIEDSTIVIGRVGEYCGCVHVTKEKVWVTDNALYVTKFLKDVNKQYLYYVLNNKDLNQYANKSGQPSISQSTILDIDILLPPLEIQKQIAKTLDTASELINLRKQQFEELDNLIKSVFYDMFGDPVTNENGWEKVGVSNVFDIIDGDRGVNYPKQEDFLDEGYCLFLNTGNVTKNGFNFDNLKFISKEKDQQLRKGKVNKGDIILTTRGTVGNIVYYDNKIPYDIVRINSGMLILRMKGNEINPHFFCELFKNPDMEREIESYKSGTAQPQLPITNLKKIKTILPPLPLQTKFAQIVSAIEEQKALVQKSIDESQYLFDGLMAKYFE